MLGRPLDERVRSGPLNDRGCKDIFFLIIYIALWVAMGFIANIAFKEGDPSILLSPYDSVIILV
jgi:hypothetical protein